MRARTGWGEAWDELRFIRQVRAATQQHDHFLCETLTICMPLSDMDLHQACLQANLQR